MTITLEHMDLAMKAADGLKQAILKAGYYNTPAMPSLANRGGVYKSTLQTDPHEPHHELAAVVQDTPAQKTFPAKPKYASLGRSA